MKANISRRQLLKSGGAFVVSFSFFGPASGVMAQDQTPFVPEPGDYLDPHELDSWLAISQDGSVKIFTGKVDFGTGVETALQQICAEELDVPFSRVHMSMGDSTAKTVDQGRTAGSLTITRAGPQLRQACAAARMELLKMASPRLGARLETLRVTDGIVSVASNPAKNVSYGDLVGDRRFDVKITANGVQWAMEVAPEVKPKDYREYKIVGQSIARIDLPAKFTGEYTYISDVRVPGMLHGRVVRPFTAVAKPESVDESSIAQIPGIVKVVQEGSFVGVVAETEWAAIQAAKALKVTWSAPQTKMPANRDEVDAYLTKTNPVRTLFPVKKGDVDSAFSQSSRVIEARYHWPFQNHAMIHPSCAIADVQADKVVIWTGAQGPFTTRDRVAVMLHLPSRQIDVRYAESSGCSGRLSADDAAEDAVLLSRAVGKPVRVQWMRAEEHVWDPKGPQQLTTVRAAVDAQGKVIAWDYLDRSLPWTEAQGMPQLAERQIGIYPSADGNPNGAGGGGETYDIENQRIGSHTLPWVFPEAMPLRTAALRAPGEPPRVFATESFIDEIAAELQVDPLQFRLRYAKDERVLDALRAVAERSGWQERPSPAPPSSGNIAVGRGLAVALRANTVPAAIAEVEVNKTTGKVTVKRVTMALDCGLIVNPDGVKNQLDGNIIQGVSRTLIEEVKFDATGIKSLDWMSYPVIRYQEIPQTEHILINRPEIPAYGAAETPIIIIPAAIANAIFDAVGVRLREIPFTPERVLNALKAKTPMSQRL